MVSNLVKRIRTEEPNEVILQVRHANFIGESNVVDAILEKDGDSKWVVLGDTRLLLPTGKKLPAREGPIKISLRPEMLHIKSESQSGTAIEGIVSQSAYMGPVIEYSINTKVGNLYTRAPAYHEKYQPNDKVYLHINPEELIVIPAAGEAKNY